MTSLALLVGFVVIVLAVVLIPLAFYESKQPSDYNEFYPIEYK